MKTLMATLAAAILATALLAAVGQVYGYHSTAGFWVGFPNLPGIVVGAWVRELLGGGHDWMDHLPGFCLIAIADWLVYFGLVKITLRLRRRRAL
jgi:hypothetical protein